MKGTKPLMLPALTVLNGGRFLSRGRGKHPERIIDSYEIIVVAAGVLGIFEEDRDFEVKAGDWLLLSPGRRHGGTLPYGRELSFFWLHFRCSERPDLPISGQLANPEKTMELLRLFLLNQEEEAGVEESADLLLRLILLECARLPVSSRPVIPLAERARELIRQFCLEPDCTAGSLAGKLGCSRDYLNRIYRQAFGLTLSAAINAARLNYAGGLLQKSTLSVKEIMHAAGFTDPAYFRRCFRRRYAVTPGVYRRRSLQQHLNFD